MQTSSQTIFIGSSSRNIEEYKKTAQHLANFLATQGHNLAFGACSTGLMGICYKEFSNKSREVISVTVPLYEEDLKNLENSTHLIVPTTFDRTKELYQKSDLLIILPGGTGTVAEIFGMLEENRSVKTPKPMFILNENGYYNHLLDFIDQCIEEGFNDPSILSYLTICNKESELEKQLSNHLINHSPNTKVTRHLNKTRLEAPESLKNDK